VDLKDTLYGIKQEKFTDYLKGRTNSMVRGEELMKLLNQIYLFIEGHVHVGPCDIPDIQTDSGVTLASIKTLIDNAEKNILNQNIRIN
jgi:translation initiation factor 2B subunit (eIF-2B alpha/beta/delta family)